MAVDSRDKRFSMLAFGKQIPQVFPNPDAGGVEELDRPQWLYLYHGSGIPIAGGQTTMTRWGGIPWMRLNRNPFGRSW